MHRFTSAFYDAISTSTPHLYVSALALAPESAGVVRRLGGFFPNTVAVASGGDKGWPGCLRTLTHPGRMMSFAISPDGRRLTIGCEDSMIRVWDMRTGAQVGEPFIGHSSKVRSVAFSPDGNLIVSGSWDHTVRVWDSRTYVALGELVGHSTIVNSVASHPMATLSSRAPRTIQCVCGTPKPLLQ